MFVAALMGGCRIIPIPDRKRNDADKSADMFFLNPATLRILPAGIVLEKAAMAFLQIGVPVGSRSRHEIDVSTQVVIGIVAAAREERLLKQVGEPERHGILPGDEMLMIVDASLPPVGCLIVKDFPLCIERFIV